MTEKEISQIVLNTNKTMKKIGSSFLSKEDGDFNSPSIHIDWDKKDKTIKLRSISYGGWDKLLVCSDSVILIPEHGERKTILNIGFMDFDDNLIRS